MKHTVQIILDGAIVSEQKNLRAIRDYSSRLRPVTDVTVFPAEPANTADHGAVLHVTWRNGATCTTTFASFALCKNYSARLAKRYGATLFTGHKAGQ